MVSTIIISTINEYLGVPKEDDFGQELDLFNFR